MRVHASSERLGAFFSMSSLLTPVTESPLGSGCLTLVPVRDVCSARPMPAGGDFQDSVMHPSILGTSHDKFEQRDPPPAQYCTSSSVLSQKALLRTTPRSEARTLNRNAGPNGNGTRASGLSPSRPKNWPAGIRLHLEQASRDYLLS